MGSRSEVALALSAKGVSALKARLEAMDEDSYVREQTRNLLKEADHHYVDADSGSEVYSWGTIKWYKHDPEYVDVQFLEDFIEKLNEDDYLFIVIGEELHHIERSGLFHDNPFRIDLVRKINIYNPSMFTSKSKLYIS